MKEKMKRGRGDFFFREMFQDPQTRQMNQPKMFRKKKKTFGRISPSFFFESSESYRVFNYLHDSNSIFRARGKNNSELFFRAHGIPRSSFTHMCGSMLSMFDSRQDGGETRRDWRLIWAVGSHLQATWPSENEEDKSQIRSGGGEGETRGWIRPCSEHQEKTSFGSSLEKLVKGCGGRPPMLDGHMTLWGSATVKVRRPKCMSMAYVSISVEDVFFDRGIFSQSMRS